MIEGLVSSLKVTEEHETIAKVSEQMVGLEKYFTQTRSNADNIKLNVLYESEDAKPLIISAHGMLPILEILEPCTVKSRQDMILWLLKVVNTVSLK
jgi:hypothetical protein